MIGITLRQLEVFAAVAAEGGMRAAAERLHLSQPALSMALGELEKQLDATLFDRERGRLHLNARGREALPLAQEILARTGDLRRGIGGKTAEISGELRLGASNTIGNYLVGDLLGAFVARHREVAVRLRVGNTDEIVAGVLDHSLDLGCVEGLVAHPRIEIEPWRDDVLAICARPDHPLARRRVLRARDFAEARWILRERGSGTRAMSERMLADLPPGETVLELDAGEAIKQAVIAGLGIALLPRVAIGDALAAGRLTALRTPFLDLRRRLVWVLRRAKYRGALVSGFLDDADSVRTARVTPPRRARRKTRA